MGFELRSREYRPGVATTWRLWSIRAGNGMILVIRIHIIKRSCHNRGIQHFRISDSILLFNRSTSYQNCQNCHSDDISKGVWRDQKRCECLHECPFNTHEAMWLSAEKTRGKWNSHSFTVYGQFLWVFIFLRPLSYESAFLENATSIEFLALQKSEILGNFGFLESQKFDRRGVFRKGNIT